MEKMYQVKLKQDARGFTFRGQRMDGRSFTCSESDLAALKRLDIVEDSTELKGEVKDGRVVVEFAENIGNFRYGGRPVAGRKVKVFSKDVPKLRARGLLAEDEEAPELEEPDQGEEAPELEDYEAVGYHAALKAVNEAGVEYADKTEPTIREAYEALRKG